MKTITFNRLKIANFKGIEYKEISLDNRTNLRGANGTGKSTIADAIWWVLFGKDSSGATDFPVKRKGLDGEDIREIIVEVELSLVVDDQTHLFRRVQEENWVTKRGELTRAFQGNVQTLYYNESKMKNIDYAKAVNDIVEEAKFKMLTSPMYFMTQIDHKARREILMKLVGNELDIEKSLIETPEFALFREEWNLDINRNKSFLNLQDYVRQKAKNNNDEIERLPFSIMELEKTITDEYDENLLRSLISGYTKELSALEAPKAITKPEVILNAEIAVRQLSKELEMIKDEAQSKYLSRRREVSMAHQEVEYARSSALAKLAMLKNEIDLRKRLKDAKQREKDVLLKEYGYIKAKTFVEPIIKTECPTCYQVLPNSSKEELIENARNEFVSNQESEINSIITKGNALKLEIELIGKDVEVFEYKQHELEEEIDTHSMQLSSLPAVSTVKEEDYIDQLKISEISESITSAQRTIQEWYASSSDTSTEAEYRMRQNELRALINDNTFRLGKLEAQKETKKRIQELKAREKILLIDRDKFKTLVYQSEMFLTKKNEALEQSLSEHFGTIRWRLFKQQGNGGTTPICDPYLNGKPYDAQSTGERIFTGVDIIKTFQGIYGVQVGLLIDNRESLTLPVDVDCQIISMYADDLYNELTLN